MEIKLNRDNGLTILFSIRLLYTLFSMFWEAVWSLINNNLFLKALNFISASCEICAGWKSICFYLLFWGRGSYGNRISRCLRAERMGRLIVWLCIQWVFEKNLNEEITHTLRILCSPLSEKSQFYIRSVIGTRIFFY